MEMPTTEVPFDVVIAKLQVKIAELTRDLAIREAQVEKLYKFIDDYLAGDEVSDPV